MVDKEIILLLVLLLASSNCFWAILSLRLMNRVMSRDYSEYVQVKRLAKKPIKPVPSDLPMSDLEPTVDIEEKKRADEISRIMGMI